MIYDFSHVPSKPGVYQFFNNKRIIYIGKGKDLKKRTVGVLIKNKQTRKKIKNDFTKLQTKTSGVVKKYLLKHNMMKVGSTAPEELLRTTYENCYLSGDVINKNPEILLHNYMQES